MIFKKIWIILLAVGLFLSPVNANAATPNTIGFQGYITSSTGVPLNGAQVFVFSLYNAATGGTALWTETQSVTVTSGIYNVVLGNTTAINLPFDAQYYLGVKVGADVEMTPRQPLMKAGYAFSADNGNPPGVIVAYGGTVAPAGWLLCDGTAVSRTTYASLFTAIGIAHGSGDGVTTFNVPDFRGRFLRGVDGTAARDPDKTLRTAMNAGGNTGNLVGSVEADQFASHTHRAKIMFFAISGTIASAARPDGLFTNDTATAGTSTQNENTGGSETRPVNAYVNYIIKY